MSTKTELDKMTDASESTEGSGGETPDKRQNAEDTDDNDPVI